MPSFRPVNSSAAYADGDVALVRGAYFTLRMRDALGAFSPTYGEMVATSIVTFAALPVSSISSFFGFSQEAIIPAGTAIGWQIALDGDAGSPTWRWWTGSAWATVATANDWSSGDDFAAHIAGLTPSMSTRPRLRARLSSDVTKKVAPELHTCALVGEVEQHLYPDAIRSLKLYIEGKLAGALTAAASRVQQKLAVAGTTFDLGTALTPTAVTRVYNLTADSSRAVNLYASLSGKTITMSAPQSQGAIIETLFRGGCPVKVGRAEEDILGPNGENAATVPCVGILVPGIDDEPRLSVGRTREVNRATNKARLRTAPAIKRVTANLYMMTAGPNAERDAMGLADALEDALGRPGTWFPYCATGEPCRVVSYEAYSSADEVARGLYVKRADVSFWVRRYDETYTESSLIQRVNLFHGGRKYVIAGV